MYYLAVWLHKYKLHITWYKLMKKKKNNNKKQKRKRKKNNNKKQNKNKNKKNQQQTNKQKNNKTNNSYSLFSPYNKICTQSREGFLFDLLFYYFP